MSSPERQSPITDAASTPTEASCSGGSEGQLWNEPDDMSMRTLAAECTLMMIDAFGLGLVDAPAAQWSATCYPVSIAVANGCGFRRSSTYAIRNRDRS